MDERIPDPLEGPRQATGPTPKRRGRPPGSISLTEEMQAAIVGLVRKGVFYGVAAGVAGVSPRTVGEWMARGQGRHPTRPATPKLRRFAREVMTAAALARVDAEIRMFRTRPKVWLRYGARTTAELDGWTAPPPGGQRSIEQQFADLIRSMDARADPEAEPNRRGRPLGSVSLTDDIASTIVTCLRAGALLRSAAEAAGVSGRTALDWLARGEGRHATRPGTPKLRRFAREVRRAQMEARAIAEARVHEEDPLHWLQHAARAEGELDGWSDPRPKEEDEADERLAEAIRRLEARRGDGATTDP